MQQEKQIALRVVIDGEYCGSCIWKRSKSLNCILAECTLFHTDLIGVDIDGVTKHIRCCIGYTVP